MKKTSKRIVKRLLALVCCVALLLTGISVSGLIRQTALADDVHGTIQITTSEVGYKQSSGFINMNYTGVPSDYKQGMDFLNEEFIAKYVSFGGGMTSTDLLNGKVIFYLATDGIIQFNWVDRTAAFKEGWSFVIAQGAQIPYLTNTGETAYVELGVEYTFQVNAGRNGYESIFLVSGYKTTTFSMDTGLLIGTGTEDKAGAGTNFMLTDTNVVDFKTAYTYMQDTESYADYIEVGDLKYTDLADKSFKIRYILDGATKCIQVETWGSVRSELHTGDQLIFRKGMPIYYTGKDGSAYKATLDATYVYECMYTDASHSQVFRGTKCVGENEYGLKTGTYTTNAQGQEVYINVVFDADSTDKIKSDAYVSENILLDKLAAGDIDVAGCSDIIIRFIPTANVLQFGFGADAVEALKKGDRIILKKGMTVVYNAGSNVAKNATLDDEYTFTVMENDGTNLTFSCGVTGSYSLNGKIGGKVAEKVGETDTYYHDVMIDPFSLPEDASFQGKFTAEGESNVMEQYFEVSGKSFADIKDTFELRRFAVSGTKALRFAVDADAYDFEAGDYVIFKKNLPIIYTSSVSGKTITLLLDKDYGYLYNGTVFVYDETLQSEDSSKEDDKQEEEKPVVVDKFGLDTALARTYQENGMNVANIGITGNPFTVEQYFYQTIANTDLDLTGCAAAATVQEGLTVQMTLASADVQVVQVKLTDAAMKALQVGDQIVLKKNTQANGAKLDDKYVLRVTGTEEGRVTFQVELTGTYGLRDVFYHSETYMDVRFSSEASLSDAVTFENAAIDDADMREYLEIAEHTHDELKSQGYSMSAYYVPALEGIRIKYQSFDLKEGTILLLKKGLPITYTTTEGKTKTVYLDKTYGYVKNEQTAFVYKEGLTEIPKTEIVSFGLKSEFGSFEEAGFTRFNMSLSNGIIEASQYIQANVMDDAEIRTYVTVDGYTTEQLLAANFRALFIPTAGTFQVVAGNVDLAKVSKMTFKEGMAVSYYDNGPKKAVLDDTYVYKITKDGDRYLMQQIRDCDIQIIVDGTEKLKGNYMTGAKLDLSQYKNTSKGKVMTIKVNGVSTQEQTLVVTEDAKVEIANRSDLCVVVFKDGKTVCEVREYALNAKNIELPYAPDKDGYDDSWEKFTLVNDVITVKAVHKEKKMNPTVNIKGAVVETEPEQSGNAKGEISSPQTSDTMNYGLWLLLALVATGVIGMTLLSKKRKTL